MANEESTQEDMRSVGFLKTHKCASSTIQNILMRWGLSHGWNFVLPSDGGYLQGTPTSSFKFRRESIQDTVWEQKGAKYQMFCLHTTWDTQEVRETIGENAVMISIVRHPVNVFDSMWNYMKLSKAYHQSLPEFISTLEDEPNKPRIHFENRFGRNQTLFDFGMNPDNMDDEKLVDAMIDTIKNDFDLIMVSERMSESKILFASVLGASAKDISSVRTNARSVKDKAASHKLTEDERRKLENWLWADMKLYRAANIWLDDKLASIPVEEKNLRLLEVEAEDKKLGVMCVEHQEGASDTLGKDFIMWADTVTGFTPQAGNSDERLRLACMAEDQFIDMLREVQTKRFT